MAKIKEGGCALVIFRGKVDPKINKSQMKRTSQQAGSILIIIVVCVITILFVLVACKVVTFSESKETFVWLGILLVLSILLIFSPTPSIHEKTGWYVNIEIDETRVRAERPYHLGTPFVEVSTGEVKKLVDYGKYYYILYGGVNRAIICQKDLLVEGTIEEFENIFAGKIVRKLKKERHKSAK